MTESDTPTCSLADKTCEPCRGGMDPLKGNALKTLAAQLSDEWTVVDEHHLTRTFKFKNFRQALAFTNTVGKLAQSIGHHPDIHLAWGRVTIEMHTHKINGLAEADFIMAAKIDQLPLPTD